MALPPECVKAIRGSTGLHGPVRIETGHQADDAAPHPGSTGLHGPVRIETVGAGVRSGRWTRSTGLHGPVRIETSDTNEQDRA